MRLTIDRPSAERLQRQAAALRLACDLADSGRLNKDNLIKRIDKVRQSHPDIGNLDAAADDIVEDLLDEGVLLDVF